MTRPRLLDLFCGAGGAAMGYYRAGFDVVGVDIAPQPRYPFAFEQGDALEYVAEHGPEFDAVHASPPCQAYTALRSLPWLRDRVYWDSIPPTRAALAELDVPWVIENVGRAPLDGIYLCGLMFGLAWPDGLPIYRHRLFESSVFMLAPGHPTHRTVLGSGRDDMAHRGAMVRGRRRGDLNGGYQIGGHQRSTLIAADPMGVGWMTGNEAAQAIPPAYTEWIGARLIAELTRRGVEVGPLNAAHG